MICGLIFVKKFVQERLKHLDCVWDCGFDRSAEAESACLRFEDPRLATYQIKKPWVTAERQTIRSTRPGSCCARRSFHARSRLTRSRLARSVKRFLAADLGSRVRRIVTS